MFKHEYKLRDIELLYGFEEGSLNFNGVVVDNETGNDLRDFDWEDYGFITRKDFEKLEKSLKPIIEKEQEKRYKKLGVSE